MYMNIKGVAQNTKIGFIFIALKLTETHHFGKELFPNTFFQIAPQLTEIYS